MPNTLTVTRYHSLVIDAATLPAELAVTAWSETREVMGVRHRALPIEGVQFHPESLFTEHGVDMVRNALRRCVHGGPAGEPGRPHALTQLQSLSRTLPRTLSH
ncbi:MAG: hypothetical protein WBA97_38565 [Actinophytocola sp.]|uniref:glutamine amidotransferase-related protein n=1 Tax=Actinophytocola sp. TaxID=1872138 RepID=UPI003C71DEF2